MDKQRIITNIKICIYKNQREIRAWDLQNMDGCQEMAEEIFQEIEKSLIPYNRELKIDQINGGS